MASLSCYKSGTKIIQFVDRCAERQTIRLGKMPKKSADQFKMHVEHLVSSHHTGHPVEAETARWVGALSDDMIARLAQVGLVQNRESATLEAFIDAYMARRTDWKESTRTAFGHTRRNLVAYFGPGHPLRSVTPGDADEWRINLIEQKLAENTIRRRSGIAKQFFQAALKKRLIESNPFSDLKSVVRGNPEKDYFISREEAQQVLDACPDAEWRLLFALCRFGGLRCPSEVLSLRWDHIDWAESRITVPSPKTEHHDGGAYRIIPLFPELFGPLREGFENAEPGAEYVITRYRATNANLRTHLRRILRRAGIEPWPKTFQNLRSTRETELAEHFPMHVICAWIGNSQTVAMNHYLQVTDQHFEEATGALQNALQHMPALPCVASREKTKTAFSSASHNNATPCNDMGSQEVGATGPERHPVTPCDSSALQPETNQRAARGAATAAKPGSDGLKEAQPTDPLLAELSRLWASMSCTTRKAILDLARSMSAEG